jgi:hypothetical protein
LKTYSACVRQWIFESLCKIRSPSTPSQILGTNVHAVLEKWQTDGTRPNKDASDDVEMRASQVMQVAFLLPKPGTARVEAAIHELLPVSLAGGRVPLRGYIDLWYGTDIYDYKTTSNPRYIKSVDELRDDIQLVVYAGWLLCYIRANPHMGLDENKITVSHVYISTKGAHTGAVIRKVPMPVAHIEEQWALIEELAHGMYSVAHEKALISQHPRADDSVCKQYGGCFHKETCHSIQHNKDNSPMPLPPPPPSGTASADALRARLASLQGTMPAPAPVVPPDAPSRAPAAFRPPAPPAPPAAPPARTAPPAPPAAPTRTAPVTQATAPVAPPAPPAPPAQRKPRNWERIMSSLGWSEDEQSRIGIPACKRLCSENLSATSYMLSTDGSEVLERLKQQEEVADTTDTDALLALNYPLDPHWGIDQINPRLVAYIIENEVDCNDLSDIDWCGCDEGETINYLVRKNGTRVYAPQQAAPYYPPTIDMPVPEVVTVTSLPLATEAHKDTQPVQPVVLDVTPEKTTRDAPSGFALYINCYATPGLCQQGIDQMISQAIREVEENNGGTPWNLGAYGASTERGQIAARVRFAVSELCAARSTELLHMFVTTDMGALSNDILAALRPFARYVVVGR